MYTHMNVFTACSRLKLEFYQLNHILSLYLIVCRYRVSNYIYIHLCVRTYRCYNSTYILYFVYDPAEQLVQVGLPSMRANWPRGHSGQ